MKFRDLKRLLFISLLGIAACSQQVETIPEPVVKPYVTNAEYILDAIATNKTSGVAFQVKPIRSSACEHMYLEFGQKNAEGQWSVTNAVFPGKNVLDNFGQDKLEDQIHFSEVNGVGEFGVIALGCKPYGREMRTYKGLFATFEVDYGRLNYIGEISLIPRGNNFSAVEVADRTEFATEQIQARLPALNQYFQENIMEKYEVKISPERQAKLDELDKKIAKLKTISEAQKKVVDEHNSYLAHLESWEQTQGYPEKELSKTLERKRKNKVGQLSYLSKKVDLYNKFIKEDRSLTYIERYIVLYDNVEKHRKILRAKYSIDWSFSKDKPKEPERKRLEDNYYAARDALTAFEKKNP